MHASGPVRTRSALRRRHGRGPHRDGDAAQPDGSAASCAGVARSSRKGMCEEQLAAAAGADRRRPRAPGGVRAGPRGRRLPGRAAGASRTSWRRGTRSREASPTRRPPGSRRNLPGSSRRGTRTPATTDRAIDWLEKGLRGWRRRSAVCLHRMPRWDPVRCGPALPSAHPPHGPAAVGGVDEPRCRSRRSHRRGLDDGRETRLGPYRVLGDARRRRNGRGLAGARHAGWSGTSR